MSLPYLEAYSQLKKGTISWETYLQHLLARFRGVEHDEDDAYNVGGMCPALSTADPFGFSIWCWSNDDRWNTKDTAPIEAVFLACHNGRFNELKERMMALNAQDAENILGSLAFLALKERRARILQFCFDKGETGDEYSFEEEADLVKRDKAPKTFAVLEQSEFRKLYPRRPRHRRKYRKGNDDPRMRAAGTFDSGGSMSVPW